MRELIRKVYMFFMRKRYPHISKSSWIGRHVKVYNPNNLYMDDYTNLYAGAIIMNGRAKLIMKHYSGAAIGLTVITGNHLSIPGFSHKMITNEEKDKLDINNELDKDVIVDEDVWIGANVTLLSGTHLGRCCIVGAGSVVRGNVPPYAIVFGNPAKIVGFRFTLKEMQIHEEKLFHEEERIPMDVLRNNYEKYYINRIKEIRNFNKL